MTTKTVNDLVFDINDNESLYKSISNEISTNPVYKKMRATYPQINKYPALGELKEYNICTEYVAIKRQIDGGYNKSPFSAGFLKVLTYMINCVLADPMNGDHYDNNNNEILKEGGRLLSEDDSMHDNLVWLFIPRRYQRLIDSLWNGIGGWMS